MKPSKKRKVKAQGQVLAAAKPSPGSGASVRLPLLIVVGVALLAACLWAYWPNIQEIRGVWRWEPDYSHGYLVVPLAIAFLWIRRDRFPSEPIRPAILAGVAMVAASMGGRYLAGRYFYGPIDNWTLILWVAGTVLALFGWRVLWWSLPSILFLWFAMPLPYRLSVGLRQPLQQVAAKLSGSVLLILGKPAISDGSLIHIGQKAYGVDEACSGLRIFFGIAAFAFAMAIISRRTWLVRLLLLLSVLPVAIISNSTRIVVTCLLFENFGSEAARKFSHDVAGFVMIPFAGAMLCVVLWLLNTIFREEEVVESSVLFQDRKLNEKSAAAGH